MPDSMTVVWRKRLYDVSWLRRGSCSHYSAARHKWRAKVAV